MKNIKINWGTGIVIAIVAFMIFILSFVYKSIVVDEYQHQLVSDDYYKEELHYQEEIDKLNNAQTLEENIKLSNVKEGLVIAFPKNLNPTEITGTITLKRFSDKKLDRSIAIKLDSNQYIISKKELVEGKWLVIVDWQYQDQSYLFKDSWFYQ